jgi:hypothetical protein
LPETHGASLGESLGESDSEVGIVFGDYPDGRDFVVTNLTRESGDDESAIRDGLDELHRQGEI